MNDSCHRLLLLLSCCLLMVQSAELSAAQVAEPSFSQILAVVPEPIIGDLGLRLAVPQQPDQWLFVSVDNRRQSLGVLPFTVSLLDWRNGKLQLLATSPAQSFDASRLQPGTFATADVDTQRWQISPKTRAIGVRMTYVRNARTVRQVQEDLFLFMYDGKVLRCVFHDVAAMRSGPGKPLADTIPGSASPAEEAAKVAAEVRTYALSTQMTNGHYDLIRSIRGNPDAPQVVHRWSVSGTNAGYGCK